MFYAIGCLYSKFPIISREDYEFLFSKKHYITSNKKALNDFNNSVVSEKIFPMIFSLTFLKLTWLDYG